MEFVLNCLYFNYKNELIKIQNFKDFFDFLNFNEDSLELNTEEIIDSVNKIFNLEETILKSKEFYIVLKKNINYSGWEYRTKKENIDWNIKNWN